MMMRFFYAAISLVWFLAAYGVLFGGVTFSPVEVGLAFLTCGLLGLIYAFGGDP